MKIAIALVGIALTAALVVSATMGAETLVPGGESTPGRESATTTAPAPQPSTTKLPLGGVTPTGKARLMAKGFAPPTLTGWGFRPGENVTVNLDGRKKKVKASASGTFTVRYPSRVDRCHGMTATAVGDKGSRAGFQLSEFMCAASGTQ
jgi:hypothetical protein